MTETYLSIAPHDPIIARDARPFGFGLRMKSLNWPYPSVLAGSLRTMLGKMNGDSFDNVTTVDKLKKVSITGPFPLYNGSLYLPAPADILVEEQKDGTRTPHAIRPMKMRAGERCNLPDEKLIPAMLPENVRDEFKPADIAPFWSIEKMETWLVEDGPASFEAPPDPKKIQELRNAGTQWACQDTAPDPTDFMEIQGFLDFPGKEPRSHVKIKSESGTAEDEMLFETVGLDFGAKGIQIAARVDIGEFAWKNSLHPLGGERRLAYWKAGADPGWACPSRIHEALTGKKYLRMVLATPAIFSSGWLPGWLDPETLEGHPPLWPDKKTPDSSSEKSGGPTLRLISACVSRWKPLSGWSLDMTNGAKPGPKPIRRVVPAGSVYFFEMTEGNAADLAENLWLRPVSDNSQDRYDGFGLALWGVWNAENESQKNE